MSKVTIINLSYDYELNVFYNDKLKMARKH